MSWTAWTVLVRNHRQYLQTLSAARLFILHCVLQHHLLGEDSVVDLRGSKSWEGFRHGSESIWILIPVLEKQL